MTRMAGAYNEGMQGWSLRLGRWFGVEVRLHPFLLLLLALSVSSAALLGEASGRGLLLWLLLLATLAVREVARTLAAAWCGLELRGLLLLPVGGVASYAGDDRPESRPALRRLALVGPAANLLFCLVLAGLIRTVSPAVDLLARPWITPGYLLRSWVWLNLLVATVHLLPMLLDGNRTRLRGGGTGLIRSGGAGLLQSLAIGMIVGGLLLGGNLALILLGSFLLIGSQVGSAGALPEAEADAIRMRDVMLMQFTTISASDTLEDALERSVHTLQDVFPVVRGANMVGAVSRQNLVEALASGGNSYVQGVMTRTFQTAKPNDAVLSTLRRIIGGKGVQLVPVIEGERVVGIITPQNLAQSMSMLNQRRRLRRAAAEPGE